MTTEVYLRYLTPEEVLRAKRGVVAKLVTDQRFDPKEVELAE
jgi:hypothetical protein